MMSSHLMSEPRNYNMLRALLIVASILALLLLGTVSAYATVSKTESGDNVKPMSTAEYAKIKALIRGTQQQYHHVSERPKVIHWKSGNASGWIAPWPK